jgi:hypothetical protein
MATPEQSGNPTGAFPKPAWPPIQNLDSVDITGKRKDGGVDLVIAVSQPLDDSTDTLDRIRRKVCYYLDVIELEEFQVEMGHPLRDRTSVIIRCDFPIHPRALAVIGECRAAAAKRGVRLAVVQ